MIDHSEKYNFSSIMLFSEEAHLYRLKATIQFIIAILLILLLNEFVINGGTSLALTMFCFIMLMMVFLWWSSIDTSSVIAGMVLWSIAILITYACWLGNGLFDTTILAFPCLLIVAIVLSGKLIFLSLFIYIVSALCFFALAQSKGLLPYVLPIENIALWGRVFSDVVILSFFSFGWFILFLDIKKRFTKMIEENTALVLVNEELRERSRHDAITLLPNEDSCKTDLKDMLQQQKASGHIIAFITFSISNLHAIKMDFSHDVYDETLKLLAKKLSSLVHDNSVLYRFQQNEFVLLMHSADHRGISRFVAKIYAAGSQTYHVNDFDVALRSDIGIALAPFDGTTMEELRHNSHLAMHASKHSSHVGFNFFDQEMAVQEQKKLKLTKALKKAIKNKELFLHYQPKIDLSTKNIIGAEALVRWSSPIHGVVSPSVFIPLAEQAGVITEITHWVIESAVIACQRWHDLGFNTLCIAVNLSAEDFKRGNLSTHTISSLNKANLAAKFLELELTESMLMDEAHAIKKQIDELRTEGISIAIDDFGTGYSNLAYLTKFNVCTLKLDRSFVHNICHSTNDLNIVKAIIDMSKSLGITNVAEGIEGVDTAQRITELGCEVGQGFFWSKPLTHDDFIALLTDTIEST